MRPYQLENSAQMTEPLSISCPTCGCTVPVGDDCATCAAGKGAGRREIVLLLILALVSAGLYLGVRALAASNHAMKISDAAYWYDEGQRQLLHQQAAAAVAAFRKASLIQHNSLGQHNSMGEHNRMYARSLAQALAADGQEAEARELLLKERQTTPEDPEINLDLARLAAQEHDLPETVRYYHNALDGIWTGPNIDLQRRIVRRELIEFLIAQHAREQTLAEMLVLAAELPNTVGAKIELGRLFLQNGDPAHALSNFRAALRTQPDNQVALEGAGEAAFQLGDYPQAQHHLWLLINPIQREKQMLNVATLAAQNDPMELRLTYARRRQRVLADFKQAGQQLQVCLAQKSGSPETQALQSVVDHQTELKHKLVAASQKDAPELAFRVLDFVYEAEETVSHSCGPLQDLDSALLLIAEKNRGTEP